MRQRYIQSCFDIKTLAIEQTRAGELRLLPGRLGRTSPGCSRSRRRTGSWGWRTCWRCGRRPSASSASWTCTGAQPARCSMQLALSPCCYTAEGSPGAVSLTAPWSPQTLQRRATSSQHRVQPLHCKSGVWSPLIPCRLDKVRENAAALDVLPDLLREVDALPPGDRLASLVQGVRRHCTEVSFTTLAQAPSCWPGGCSFAGRRLRHFGARGEAQPHKASHSGFCTTVLTTLLGVIQGPGLFLALLAPCSPSLPPG